MGLCQRGSGAGLKAWPLDQFEQRQRMILKITETRIRDWGKGREVRFMETELQLGKRERSGGGVGGRLHNGANVRHGAKLCP